ncbi:hypothetical protein N0V93_004246 [Gnomoniopsis smithogilvyi]|uniref:Uncharacterized protein n=1 Tax=Gnomoniopsis smithogilvyi TaxID=1191159 RepID=A0A9W9CW11_9PEZI|nr:hypothetical protein N0V93_004246 [Gnomoniopsis smithogilvyi]
MQWRSWSYNPVDSEQPEADEKQDASLLGGRRQWQQSLSPPSTTRIISLSASIAAVFFCCLYLFMPRPWLAADHPGQIRYFNCGNSTQDASAAGCKFDVMSYTWVHPKCFDQELMYDFLGQDDWKWYESEDGLGQPLNASEVTRGQREYVYVTWKYYTTHCTYMWRKMHRSILTSRALDSYVSDYRHTEQCETVLNDRERGLDETSVMLVVKYPSCPII